MSRAARTPTPATFQRTIFAWFRRHGRHRLPWRRARTTPWHVLISEIMLQQTQVDRVIPKYRAFVRRWPTPAALATAPLADVIAAWSGLGYNRRAVGLRNAAVAIVERHNGRVPVDTDALLALPGIGPYTAGAVQAFAFNRDAVVCDTNIRRIVARVFAGGEFARTPLTEPRVARLLARMLPTGRGRDWYGALMDFGSAVCTGVSPACATCPLRRQCAAAPRFLAGASVRHRLVRPQAKFEGSMRQRRGAVLKALTTAQDGPGMTRSQVARLTQLEDPDALISQLVKEGLCTVVRGRVRLADG